MVQFNIIFPKEFSDEQREQLIKALGKPTEIPSDLEPKKLVIEKTAEEIQNEDSEEEHHHEDDEEGGGRGQSCVQQ